MYPSEEKRNSALKWSSYKFAKKLWIILMVVLVPLSFLLPILLPLLPQEKLIFAAAVAAFWLFLGGMAFGIMAIIKKVLMNGLEEYEPIVENRVSIKTLCEEAMRLNEETSWQVEPHVNEGWIDVTWKWKDSIDAARLGAMKDEEIYYKLIKLYDDYTYDDLDMLTSKKAMLGLGGGAFSKGFSIGHIQSKQYNVSLGMRDGEAGVHQYTLDTTELTNYMHRWLAEHGYAYRGM